MNQDKIEIAKNVGDAVVIPTGVVVSISYWITDIINPLITALIGLMTIIWLFYRIKVSKSQTKK